MSGWLFGITVTLVTRTKAVDPDVDGNDVYTAVNSSIDGCAFDPGGSTEFVQGQDMVVSQPVLYTPSGTVVDPYAQFIVNGATYEVDGSPNAYESPLSGWQPGVAIKLKRVTG